MSEIEQAIRFLEKNRDAIQDKDNQLIPQTIKDEVSMPYELAVQALQEKADREKQQAECKYCHDASFRQAGQYVDSEEGYKISGINHYCINCGRKLVEK